MILVFDTETTGKAEFNLPPEHPSQPRLVQLGAQLITPDRRVVGEINLLVRPDGWTVPADAQAVHGISTEMCATYGLKVETVVLLFAQLLRTAERVVAHNYDFDKLIALRELGPVSPTMATLFRQKAAYCTMKAATPICRLPGRMGTYKWPSLQEAYRHFFSQGFEGAHDAMADVRACARVYWALQDHAAEMSKPVTQT
jgi:DNA polymerase-3 subunit epsilon